MRNFIVILLTLFVMFGCNNPSDMDNMRAGAINGSRELSSLKEVSEGVSIQKSRGTYKDFLTALRTFESSIDPKQAEYYAKNYNNPNAVNYQVVEYPGRVIRDKNGHPLTQSMSIEEYFITLGIEDLYTPGSTDPAMFTRMQYSVINFLGFVGYQFSEQDLWVLGYYTHYDKDNLPEYYSDLPDSTWANGVRNKIVQLPDSSKAHITDVNTWRGTFTGKHGINNFDDYKDPAKQEFIALDHFEYKYNNIKKLLAKHGKTIDDFIGTSLYWDECVPPISPPPGGRSNKVVVTMSGLLAGAHLRGAAGVEALLIKHENHADEIGTTILQYVQDYGNYDTPFKQQQET